MTGLAGGDVCTCSTQADWATLTSFACYGATNQINWVLVNAGGSAVNAPASTVDYCCLRK